MEGNVLDVLRVLVLVLVWAIPAILVLAVVVFAIAAPALTLAGVVDRLYEVVHDKLRRRTRAEMQLPIDTHAVILDAQETVAAHDDRTGEAAQKEAATKELVGKKS